MLLDHLWPEGGNRIDLTKKPSFEGFFFLYRLGKCFKFHVEYFIVLKNKKYNETKC